MTPVSVIIPAYNAQDTLRRAVESALDQTAVDVDVLIINDASRDRTRNIASSLAERHPDVTLLDHEQRQGPAGARNTGISNATREYLAFLDADDRWKPSKLRKQLRKMQKESSAICFTNLEIYNQQGEFERFKKNDFEQPLEQVLLEIYLGIISNLTPTLLFKRSVVNTIGPLNQKLDYREDHWFVMNAISHFPYSHVPEPLVERHKVPGSYSDPNTRDHGKEIESYERFNEMAVDKFEFLKQHEDRFLTDLYFYRIEHIDKDQLRKINTSRLGFYGQIKYYLYRYKLGFVWKILRFPKKILSKKP